MCPRVALLLAVVLIALPAAAEPCLDTWSTASWAAPLWELLGGWFTPEPVDGSGPTPRCRSNGGHDRGDTGPPGPRAAPPDRDVTTVQQSDEGSGNTYPTLDPDG